MSWFTITSGKIKVFALLCVAVTSGFVMWLLWKLIDILAAPDWCARAINAEKLTTGRSTSSIGTCQELLLKQIGSLALNSHILAGIIAVSLGVLIIVVVADARFRGALSKDGATLDVSRDDGKVDAAEKVAGAAVQKAEEIKEQVDDPRP